MSSIIPLSSTPATMSSREIAELTGKRHYDVLRDIDRLVDSLNADLRLGFQSSTYKDATGKENRMYLMDRDSSICLVAGYDANARMRIIKRWQELESKQPASPYTALSSHTVRATQIGNSKAVNQVQVALGGANAAIQYNMKNCAIQSGRLPVEWKHIAKTEGLPAKHRGSAKDVLRVKAPQIACGMSLADQLVSGGAKPDDGISIGKDSQHIFQRILALGITPPELLL